MDMGQSHVRPGTTVSYAFCPPTSGSHYDFGARAPLSQGFYDADDGVSPGNWIHNLEHGWVVLAYRDPEGADGPTSEELSQMRSFIESAPLSPAAVACAPNKVIAVRFDDMSTRFGLMIWDRSLLTDTFDPEEALTFYQQWVDSAQAPERGFCP